jgi:hypothetical protein
MNQCCDLIEAAAYGSNMDGPIAEISCLIHVVKWNLAKLRQFFVLITAQNICGIKALRVSARLEHRNIRPV